MTAATEEGHSMWATAVDLRDGRELWRTDLFENEQLVYLLGQDVELECKVLVLAGGAMANAPLLMRSRPQPGKSAS